MARRLLYNVKLIYLEDAITNEGATLDAKSIEYLWAKTIDGSKSALEYGLPWDWKFIPKLPSSQPQEEGTTDMMNTLIKIQTVSSFSVSRFTLHRLEKWPSLLHLYKENPRGGWRHARPRLGIKSNPKTALTFSSCQQVAHLSYICFAHLVKLKQPEGSSTCEFQEWISFHSCITLWQRAPHVLHSETNLYCGREMR